MAKNRKRWLLNCPKCEAKESVLYTEVVDTIKKETNIKIDKCDNCKKGVGIKQTMHYNYPESKAQNA